MRFPYETYRSSVYLNFKEIDSQEYQSIVRFFEQHEDDIRQLTFEEHIEMQLAYVAALFEVGAYSNYINCCDNAIESVIYFNIADFEGENIFRKLLFRKAASLYQLMQYDKCEHILLELINMDEKDKLTILLLKKCYRAKPPQIVRKSRAVSVLFFLVAACVIGIELFMVKTFFPEYGMITEYTRNSIFCLGWVILISGGLYQFCIANAQVKQKLKGIKSKTK